MSQAREHWLAIGSVSKAARKRLIEANCPVLDVSSSPPVVLVCLPHEVTGEHFYEDMALTDVGEIQIKLKGLCLCWHFAGDWQVATSSVTEMELVTCEE
jgi:hypothetical protein